MLYSNYLRDNFLDRYKKLKYLVILFNIFYNKFILIILIDIKLFLIVCFLFFYIVKKQTGPYAYITFYYYFIYIYKIKIKTQIPCEEDFEWRKGRAPYVSDLDDRLWQGRFASHSKGQTFFSPLTFFNLS